MSPVIVRKIRGKRFWTVKEKRKGGRIFARKTTKKRALAQLRLLRGLAHGMIKR
jgi:hypothetical protein